MGDRKQPTPAPPGSKKPDPPPAPPRSGSQTADYKARLRAHVDRACYRRIVGLSNDILKKLPKNEGLGDLSAALMLAATAFGEAAANARRIVEVPDEN